MVDSGAKSQPLRWISKFSELIWLFNSLQTGTSPFLRGIYMCIYIYCSHIFAPISMVHGFPMFSVELITKGWDGKIHRNGWYDETLYLTVKTVGSGEEFPLDQFIDYRNLVLMWTRANIAFIIIQIWLWSLIYQGYIKGSSIIPWPIIAQ